MKKLLAFVLVLGMLLSFAACGKKKGESNVPEDYQLASNDTYCDYTLYVPDEEHGWTVEKKNSDFSMAAFESGDDFCSVSVTVGALTSECPDIVSYWNAHKGEYSFLTDCTVGDAEPTEIKVGGAKIPAYRYTFTGSYAGESYGFAQVLFARQSFLSGTVYCVTFTATEGCYVKQYETFEKILSYMEFDGVESGDDAADGETDGGGAQE